MGFTSKWPEIERFYTGDQWPAVTEATKHINRPTTELMEYIVRMKTANVLSQSMKMQFLPEEIGEESPMADRIGSASRDFTDFASHTWYDIGQDYLNMLMVMDAAKLGPGILHYRWDGEAIGGTLTKYRGKLAGEVIDPMCVFFGNPQLVHVQRQPYILVASREDTDLLRERAAKPEDKGGYGLSGDDLKAVEPDDGSDIEKYPGEIANDTGNRKTTVLTRYWRKGGEVYMTKATRAVELVKERRMNGNRLYPFEVFQWKPRKRCIYGMGECESLIPVIKYINVNKMATQQALLLMGFPKLMAYAGALEKDPTNRIGEILINLLNDPNAVRYLDSPQINNAVFGFSDNLITEARTLSGATEVMGGDKIVSGMAASAVMAIQQQNRMPIAYIQQTLYRSMANVGKIWEEFFKNFQTLPRPMVVKDSVGMQHTKLFTGSDYADVSFTLRVEVGPSSQFSEITGQTVLDNMYNRNDIDADDYVELSPANAVPWSEEFKRRREAKAQQSGVIAQLLESGTLTPEAFVAMVQGGVIPQGIAAQMMPMLQQQAPQAQPQDPQ
jgi:hypothetical protein